MKFLKKKNKSKLIAKTLVAVSLLGMSIGYNFIFTEPIKVNAATTSTITINNLTYTYSGTTATLTKVTQNGPVTIPSIITVDGSKYTVTSIGEMAFAYATNTTSITIPNTVTTLGEYAFENTFITSITIPSSVKSIGEYCFMNCKSLKSITIPSSVESIGAACFVNCTNLQSVTLPNSITSIGNITFSGCTSLKSITIPNSVTSIGQGAFDKCTGLGSITIPSSVTSIEDYAFRNCTGLKSVYFKDNASYKYSNIAFPGCTNVTTLGIGNILYTLNNSNLTATTSSNISDIPYTIDFANNIYSVVISN